MPMRHWYLVLPLLFSCASCEEENGLARMEAEPPTVDSKQEIDSGLVEVTGLYLLTRRLPVWPRG